MDSRSRCWFVTVILSMFIWGCASQPVKTVESGLPADSNNKVLIATQKTKFKQAVVSKIHEELKQNSIYLKIVDIKVLKSQNTGEFSVVVIISRAMAGRPDPRVESFIDRETRKNKLILLTTGGLDSWKPDTPGVDAMTSASVMDKSDQIARSIIKKVMARVNSQNTK